MTVSSISNSSTPIRTGRAAAPAAPTQEPMTFTVADQVEIRGHAASDPLHAQYPTSSYPLRTYMLTQDNRVASVDFNQLLEGMKARSYPSTRYEVTQKELDQVVKQSGERRQQRLEQLDQLDAGVRATPKDSSLNPTTMTLFSKSLTEVSGVYAQQLAQIGQVEGFEVVLASNSGKLANELHKQNVENISSVIIPDGEVWVEDYGEPLLGQGWVAPAIFQGVDLRQSINDGRKERMPDVNINFSQHGAVNQGKRQPVAMALATAASGEARQALSYMEGGNILVGTRADGQPYALIGRDSLAVTEDILEKQTGKDVTPEKVLEVVASDLGLPREAVFGVEQPGEFHIDMRMMPIAPGEIALNDAVGAAEQQIAWMRSELKEALALPGADPAKVQQRFDDRFLAMREEAERRAVYEKLAQKDLEAAGLTVHRLAGVFTKPGSPSKDASNFFNARHGVNEQGERFSIFMGGKPQEEAYVADMILNRFDTQISRLHFLDPSQTQLTLDKQGGLKCRTKPDGELVPTAQLDQPTQGRLTA